MEKIQKDSASASSIKTRIKTIFALVNSFIRTIAQSITTRIRL